MSSGYALLCVSGPMAGQWYMRRGVVLRFTRVHACALVGQLNGRGDSTWFATKHRAWVQRHGGDTGHVKT